MNAREVERLFEETVYTMEQLALKLVAVEKQMNALQFRVTALEQDKLFKAAQDRPDRREWIEAQ